jgi:hypothetical protein
MLLYNGRKEKAKIVGKLSPAEAVGKTNSFFKLTGENTG